MTGLLHFLQGQPFIVIFGVVAVGMMLGKRSVRGISLGSVVCIIVAGLLISIWSYNATGVSLALPDVLKTIFFNLFIFAMGVKIGPQFFAGLERDGWHMVAIGLIVAVLAPALCYLCGWVFDLPQGAVAGLLAGGNNSSASFGTASSAIQSEAFRVRPGGSADLVSGMLAASFALAYTLGEVQYVLFMKALPALGGFDAPAAARDFERSIHIDEAPLPGTAAAVQAQDPAITIRAYRASSAMTGRTVGEIRSRAPRVSIELVRRTAGDVTPTDATVLEAGDEVVVSAPLAAQVRVREALGPELPDADARAAMALQTVDVVVGRSEAVGGSLAEIANRLGGGVYPNALFRAGERLPMGSATSLKSGDVLRVTATEPRIAELGRRVGQVIRASHESDILTLALGLVVGAVLGAIPVPLFGVSISFGATAVLVTGILFGWLKTRHPALGGPISEGARRLMEELGLNVFTAVLAVNSGQAVYQVMTNGPVWALVVTCLIVSAVPGAVAWWVGRHVLQVNPALLMGAIAGARQNTASLRAAERATESAVPGVGYPVPLALATMVLSVVSYFFALFA